MNKHNCFLGHTKKSPCNYGGILGICLLYDVDENNPKKNVTPGSGNFNVNTRQFQFILLLQIIPQFLNFGFNRTLKDVFNEFHKLP